MNRVTKIYSLYLLAALVVCAGCSTGKSKSWKFAKNWDVRRLVGLKSNKPAPPEIPMRLASSWTDTVLNKTGQKPQRGFGGRLTFFEQDNETPVRIDGQLVVYAFEETEGQPRSTQPTRRYVFPQDQFVQHENESPLGPYYSVWLPWDEVGGERKNISLIARFEPVGGPLIMGEQTRHLLPGRAVLAKSKAEAPKASGQVQLAQHTSTHAEHVSPATSTEAISRTKLRMTTTSIPLPGNWKQRLTSNRKAKTAGEQNAGSTTVREPAGAPRL